MCDENVRIVGFVKLAMINFVVISSTSICSCGTPNGLSSDDKMTLSFSPPKVIATFGCI